MDFSETELSSHFIYRVGVSFEALSYLGQVTLILKYRRYFNGSSCGYVCGYVGMSLDKIGFRDFDMSVQRQGYSLSVQQQKYNWAKQSVCAAIISKNARL